jgi:flagellar biosynthesis anti-sigma factor FlgM
MNVRNGIDHVKQIFPSQVASINHSTQGAVSPSAEANVGDSANVSSAAGRAITSSAESDVRLDKVAAVQKALQAGTYQVPAEKVAEAIISSMMASET